jgi:WD40 repeat protein
MSFRKLSLRHALGGHESAIYGLTHSADASQFFTAGGDGWIVRWDMHQPDPGRLIARMDSQVFCIQALDESGSFVAGSMHGGVHWMDTVGESGSINIAHHRNGVYAFRLYNHHLFSAGGDGRLTRWSLATRLPEASWQLSRMAIRCMDIHPSGAILVVGASDGRIYYLSYPEMRLLHITEAAHVPSVFSLKFSQDGRFLWSGGRDAHLRCWSIWEDYQLLFEVPAHLFTVNAMAFDPSGQWLATASRDKTIRIWDVDALQLLQSLDTVRDQGHRNSVNNLLWIGDPEPTLISVSDDRTVRMWSSAPGGM